jgi:hypothetical protein
VQRFRDSKNRSYMEIDGALTTSQLGRGSRGLCSKQPGTEKEAQTGWRFYAALLAKGMRPEMARLTLARKIATIVLIVGNR